jgi:hypothetical protein
MGEYTDAVRRERATELERLGSDRGLIALTGADLSATGIRRAVAAGDLAVADVVASWDDEDFAAAAGTIREQAAELSAPLDESVAAAPEDPVAAALASQKSFPERAGAAFVGYPLVADGRYLQAVSFFVNEADDDAAAAFRSARDGAQSLQDRGGERLGALDDAESEAAVGAAIDVVDAAYAWYVETLEGMGLDPKTVC